MDHREISQDMCLFMFSDYAPGQPIWLPNGNTIYSLLAEKIRECQKSSGYVEVRTPLLCRTILFEKSGHLDHYAENMYSTADGIEEFLKPMNCPMHMAIFKSRHWSYQELPYRIADMGVLHRKEVSGAVGGLTRCRAFCQDDAHCFVTPETLESEIHAISNMVNRVYTAFNMEVRVVVGTRPEQFMGEVAQWNIAEGILKDVVDDCEEDVGGGAFYGPKIDFYVKDSQDKEWQTATIQLDYQLPQRFDLRYTDKDNKEKCPIVIHRAVFGSFERFIAILLEHYQGRLPFWLAPVQGVILPISDRQNEYAQECLERLWKYRFELDDSNNTLSHKIAVAQEKLIPQMLVIGEREQNNRYVNIRDLDGDQKTLDIGTYVQGCDTQNTFRF